MLTVYGTGATLGRLNASPFVGKLETWLRLAGIPYAVKVGNPLRAPKGKVPYIDDDGLVLADSQLIIAHLTRARGVTLDDHLSDGERAVGHAVRRMLEEATYFCALYARWIRPQGWAAYKPVMRAVAPALVLEWLRYDLRKRLKAQGTGRHTDEEILAFAAADFRAVAGVLGDRPFLLGDRPTSFDATVFAFTQGALAFPGDSPVKDAVLASPGLLAYVDRVEALAWPEGALAHRPSPRG